MKYEIKYKPAYSLLVVQLSAGESLTAEAGAMAYMQPTLDVKTHKRDKSFWGTLGMTIVGGQSFFINDFTSTAALGEAAFSSAPLGDIDTLDVQPGKGDISSRNRRMLLRRKVSTLTSSGRDLQKGSLVRDCS